jgi:hypothetical protein
MTEEKQALDKAHPEGTTSGDPSIGETGVDKVLLRVEGQNENITTPPQSAQVDVAKTARDLDDLTMGIEDESGA